MISASRQSTRVIHASRAGVPLDGNLALGGGTDAAPALQRLLDSAQAGPLHLVVDGAASVGTPLRIYSDTTIEFLGGCGLFARPGLDGPILRNAHWVSGYNGGSPVDDGSTIVDHHIRLVGGTLVGNRAGGCCTGSGPQFAGSNPPAGLVAEQFVSPAMFFGVRDLSIAGTAILDPPSFHLWLANCFRVRLADLTMIDPVATTTVGRNTDGLHCNGPIDDLTLFGLRAAVNDDAIALNADDINIDGSTAPHDGAASFGSFASVYRGPITRVRVDAVHLDRSLSALRFLCGPSVIDDVTIGNVAGSVYYHAVAGNTGGAFPGPAAKGRIVLENWAVDQTGPGDGFMSFDGAIDHLTLRNVRRTVGGANIAAPIRLSGAIGSLRVEDLDVLDRGDAAPGPLIQFSNAAIGSAALDGAWVRGAGAGVPANPFVQVDASSSFGDLHLGTASASSGPNPPASVLTPADSFNRSGS